MTNDEFIRIATVLRGYYPSIQITDNPDVFQVWLDAFSRYDKEVVMRAVKQYGDNEKYPPTVSDIKDIIKKNFKVQSNSNDCPHCNGRGYVLVHIKNEDTNRLYNGNDWANDYAVPCEHCHGWHYVTRQEAEERKKK